ncbi:MAG: hypothetical protein NZL93_01200, partial [Chthoniobacterales bacterium]|nr:hypothetical protein [Chthoniobacterales bacterium]
MSEWGMGVLDRREDEEVWIADGRERRVVCGSKKEMSAGYKVAIVGATGAVGEEMLRVLERRKFPVSEVGLFASGRSAGRRMKFFGEEVEVRELRRDSLDGYDFALFSAGSGVSREYAPIVAKAGVVVVDNSSAFRMEPEVPLVVPEINGEDVFLHRGIIANPNCTTAITLMALAPLHWL